MDKQKREKIEAGIQKVKVEFDNVVNVVNNEVLKNRTPGQKFAAIGIGAFLLILIVALIGRLVVFNPNVSIWGVSDAPISEFSFKIDGAVSQVLVFEGQIAAEGELIARIDGDLHLPAWNEANNQAMEANFSLLLMDDRFKPSDVSVAEANLKAAEGAAEAASAAFERAKIYENEFKTSAEEGAISEAHHEESVQMLIAVENNLKRANFDVENAKSTLEKVTQGFSEEEIAKVRAEADAAAAKTDAARSSLEGASIVAPFDSYIVKLALREGIKIIPNEPVCELADMSKLYIKSFIDEATVKKIKIGAPVHVEFRDIKNTEFTGKVASVSAPANSKYEVRIELDNADRVLPFMEAMIIFADI